jgi:cation diffusion facilitator CzcD-associated flavoprotein CzcO
MELLDDMRETQVVIVGASFSGLASAVCLQKEGIEYVILEKTNAVATPWRNHYERLHLHTTKRISNLPYKKFDSAIARYPTRQQVVAYLDDYQKEFDIRPVFNTEVHSIKRDSDHWLIETNNGIYVSKYVVVATGPFTKPRQLHFRGMQSFPGKILHSYGYRTGREFAGEKVLVVGFGNSACEIAIDLYEQGAKPSMSVRSPVNIVPRDAFGIPILELSILMSRMPPRLADRINAPLLRLLVGDITKLGLKKMPYGPFEQIERDGNVPVLDIGTLKHIRQGHIKVYDDIDHIEGRSVYFEDGKREDFDAIVAAIGYYRDYAEIIDLDKSRFEDLRVCASKQKYFGRDGLYFCGFWIAPTGQIREIGLDARKIAKDIARKVKSQK